MVIETSPDGASWIQVHAMTLSSFMPGSVSDPDTGGRKVAVNVALATQSTGSYACIRVTGGTPWLGVGPGGFN